MAGLVATNYGEALFELAKEEEKLDVFKNDLANIEDVISKNDDLQMVLSHPKIEKNDKKELMIKIFNDIDPYVSNFVRLLIDKNRIANLMDINKEYIKLYKTWLNSGIKLYFMHKKYIIEGVQFHPEAELTEHGHQLLKNFIDLCKNDGGNL